MANKLVDSYLVYQLVSRLVRPFDKWPAFQRGIIDKNGTVLKKHSELTPQDLTDWGYFDILVANIKKMIGKLPGGKTRLANFTAAVYLMKEHKQYKEDEIEQLTEACKQHLMMLSEDGVVNNVGQGAIAGVGIGPQGEPPGKTALLRKMRMMTRKRLDVATKPTP